MAKIIDELTVKINMVPCLDDNQLGLLKMIVDQEIANVRGRASSGYTAAVFTLKKTLDEAYKNRINRTDIEIKEDRMLKVNPTAWLNEEQLRLLKDIVVDEMIKVWQERSDLDSYKLIALNDILYRGLENHKGYLFQGVWLGEDDLLFLREIVNRERNNTMFGGSERSFKQVDSLFNVIRSKCSNLKETKTPDTEKPEVKAGRIYKSVTYTTSFDVANVLIKGALPDPWTVRIDYNVCLDDNARYFVVNLERGVEAYTQFFKSIVYESFENISFLEHRFFPGHYYTLKGIGWDSSYPNPCAGNLAAPAGSDSQFILSDEASALLKREYFELKELADDEVRRHVHG